MAAIGVLSVAGKHYLVQRVPAHAAATATESLAVLFLGNDSAIDVTAVYHVPDTVVTGADTNSTNLNLLDAGTGGAGTTELGHIDYALGTNTSALDARAFVTAALTTFTRYALPAGAVLALQYEKVGTGLAIPAGLLVVEFEPR
jgi:hypothetical protein